MVWCGVLWGGVMCTVYYFAVRRAPCRAACCLLLVAGLLLRLLLFVAPVAFVATTCRAAGLPIFEKMKNEE